LAAELTVQAIGLDRVQGLTKRLRHELDEAERLGITKSAIAVEQRAKERLSRTSGGQEDFLWVRSGALRASVAHTAAERDSQGWLSRVGFRRGRVDKYAPTQEFGATISARGGGYLRFPIREGGGLAKSGITGWRSVKSVTVPARRPLGRSLQERRELIAQYIAAEVQAAVGRAALP